jgi:hypothetical protein
LACGLTLGSGTLTINGAVGSTIDFSYASFTLTANTSNVRVINNNSAAISGSKTYYKFEIGTAAVSFGGSNTFNNSFTFFPNSSRVVTFAAGTTQTFGGTLSAKNGTFTCSTTVSLVKTSGTVVFDVMTLVGQVASGGASFYAVRSTNTARNTGWTFGAPPGFAIVSNISGTSLLAIEKIHGWGVVIFNKINDQKIIN